MPSLLCWNQTTNQVSTVPYDQSPAQIVATRGNFDLLVVCQTGDVNDGSDVLLDPALTVGIVIRDATALKIGKLAGPTALARGGTADAGYTGTINTNSPLVRDVMHADPGDPTPEVEFYQVSAVLYYEGTSGGAPFESLPFSWTILPAYNDADTPPADIVVPYPSAAQLTAAVALAAVAEPRLGNPSTDGMVLFSTAAGVRSWGAFPSNFPGNLGIAGNITAGGTLTVSGAATAASFAGDGLALTNLNASNLTSGTIPLARLPAAVAGALNYLGTWDATANSPALASGTGTKGGYYVVATSGTTAIDGVAVWTAGDWIVFDGTRWDKLDGAANPVASVAGRQGAIVLSSGDLSDAAALAYLSSSPTFTGTVSAAGFIGAGGGLTGMAPFHVPNTTGTTGFAAAIGLGSLAQSCNDISGEITFGFSTSVNPGTVVGTLNFVRPYVAPLPATILWLLVSASGTGGLVAAMKSDGSGLTVSVGATAIGGGSYKYQYVIPIR